MGDYIDNLLEAAIARLAALREVGGTSSRRLFNQLREKPKSSFHLTKALSKGLSMNLLAQTGGKWYAVGYPPPPPPSVLCEDLEVGTGPAAAAGTKCTMGYVGTLQSSGALFDQSANFTFTPGDGEMIKGWEEGVLGLRVGGTRRMIIPPELAYGKRGFPPNIPPSSTLVYVVQLLKVE